VKVDAFKKSVIRRVFFVTQLTNLGIIFTSTAVNVSPAGEQEGENEPGAGRVSLQNKGEDPKFSLTPELIRAVASWDVAVTMEAKLREDDAVRLLFGHKGGPLLKKPPFRDPAFLFHF
jgi:hypothetical protein